MIHPEPRLTAQGIYEKQLPDKLIDYSGNE